MKRTKTCSFARSAPSSGAFAIFAALAIFAGSVTSTSGAPSGIPVPSPPPKPDLKSNPRCYPPQGESIPAAKVMKDLADGRDVDLTGRIIEGNIDADLFAGPAVDDRKVSLRVVRGRLRLDSCRINGRIALPHSVLNDVILTCDEIMGDIDLSDSEIRGGVNLDRSKVFGEVRLARAQIDRDVTARSAVLEDSLEISGASAGSISVSGAELHRSFEVSNSLVTSIDVSAAKITGSVKIEESLIIGNVSGMQSTIDRGMTVEGCRVKGALSVSGANIQGGLTIASTTLEGNLVLCATLQGALAINDVSTRQNFVVIDGRFAEASITTVQIWGSTDMTGSEFSGKVVLADTDFGRGFQATELYFIDQVEMKKVKFPGEDPMSGIRFAKTPTVTDTVLPHPPNVSGKEAPYADEDDYADPE